MWRFSTYNTIFGFGRKCSPLRTIEAINFDILSKQKSPRAYIEK
jgi:hypothetical protein